MPGEPLFELKGKIIEILSLPNGNREYTCESQGHFEGEHITCTWTSEGWSKSDGNGGIDFRGFFITKGGTMGRYLGIGTGVHCPDGSMKYTGCVCMNNVPGKRITPEGVEVSYEFDVDEVGGFNYRGWKRKTLIEVGAEKYGRSDERIDQGLHGGG